MSFWKPSLAQAVETRRSESDPGAMCDSLTVSHGHRRGQALRLCTDAEEQQ